MDIVKYNTPYGIYTINENFDIYCNGNVIDLSHTILDTALTAVRDSIIMKQNDISSSIKNQIELLQEQIISLELQTSHIFDIELYRVKL